MWKRTFVAGAMAALSFAAVSWAQENATITLRSGERLTVQVMDLGGVGFTVRVNGQERQIPTSDVAVIDFTGGSLNSSDWAKLSGGQHVMFLKSGETVTGQLVDIGGSAPLRITFKTTSGDRDYSSSDVGRIVFAQPSSTPTSSVATSGSASSTAQGITVSSQQQWTPTGIAVRRGDWVTFSTTGDVKIGGEGNPTSGPDGVSATTLAPGAPLAGSPAGALIGRVGNSGAFLIGSKTRVQMPAAGQLFLAVNDGHLADNEGSFQVQVAREGGVLRR
jgi:hypothetical protein